MKIPNKIYGTLFSALVSYEQQAMIEIQNEHKESEQRLKNIKLTFVWLKQFKKKDFKLNT
tara:strand:+ start:1100 stop:1279 length:180 start_codon:yes stop_codon:yes gene_type:complete